MLSSDNGPSYHYIIHALVRAMGDSISHKTMDGLIGIKSGKPVSAWKGWIDSETEHLSVVSNSQRLISMGVWFRILLMQT